MKDQKNVYWEINNEIGSIVLNQHPSNRMNKLFLDDLFSAIKEAESAINDVKAVLIYSTGRHFSAGADLEDIKRFILEGIKKNEKSISFFDNVYRSSREFSKISSMPVPVIALLSGVCIGSGLELALAAHIRIAEANAVLGLPELTWNLIPGCGGTLRLPCLIGRDAAAYYILTADTISGREAWERGLVDMVVKRPELMDAGRKLATKITDYPQPVVKKLMKIINKNEE